MVFTYKDPCSKKRSYRLLLCWLGKLCNHVYYFLIIDLLGPRSVQHKMLVLYQNCNASQTLRSNLIINRVKLNYETSVYIAIACEGFSFRQEYVQDCSVFMVGFFYTLSRICLHLRLKNECSS